MCAYISKLVGLLACFTRFYFWLLLSRSNVTSSFFFLNVHFERVTSVDFCHNELTLGNGRKIISLISILSPQYQLVHL